MDLSDIATMTGIVTSVVGGFNWFTSQKIDTFKSEVGKWRAEDKNEIKQWINGSFMRSAEAHSRLDGIDHRLDRIEDRSDRP
jgi:hypothetical protein